jgi:hypothetical protein
MKKIALLFFFVSVSAVAQKIERTSFRSLQNIESTDFTVTYTANYSKIATNKEESKIVFINTKTGQTQEVNLSKKTNLRKIITNNDANYLGSKFVVLECYSEVEKTLPKASNSVNELYLITLNDFKLVKISSSNFTIRDWVINNETKKIVFIEQENGIKDLSGEVQKIMIFDLENGSLNEVFSNN